MQDSSADCSAETPVHERWREWCGMGMDKVATLQPNFSPLRHTTRLCCPTHCNLFGYLDRPSLPQGRYFLRRVSSQQGPASLGRISTMLRFARMHPGFPFLHLNLEAALVTIIFAFTVFLEESFQLVGEGAPGELRVFRLDASLALSRSFSWIWSFRPYGTRCYALYLMILTFARLTDANHKHSTPSYFVKSLLLAGFVPKRQVHYSFLL